MEGKAYGMTPTEIDDCYTTFILYDRDYSGTIDIMELKACLKTLCGNRMSDNLIDRFVDMQMNSVDKDKNRHIDFKEFIQMYAKFAKGRV